MMFIYLRTTISLTVLAFLSLLQSPSLSFGNSAIESNINREDYTMHPVEKALNVKLKHPSLELYEDVQELFERQIEIEIIDSDDPYYCGESNVNENGIPIIKINKAARFKEETFVHELFHLKLRNEGFPRYKWATLPGCAVDIDVKWLENEVRDTIQHTIFFPEMKKIEVDPFGNMKVAFSRILKTGSFFSKSDPFINAAIFMMLVLETDDNELACQLEQYFEEYGWADSVKEGKELIGIIKARKLHTPEDEVETFIKCINILFKGKTSVQVWEWGINKVGLHTDRTVTILVTPYNK